MKTEEKFTTNVIIVVINLLHLIGLGLTVLKNRVPRIQTTQRGNAYFIA